MTEEGTAWGGAAAWNGSAIKSNRLFGGGTIPEDVAMFGAKCSDCGKIAGYVGVYVGGGSAVSVEFRCVCGNRVWFRHANGVD